MFRSVFEVSRPTGTHTVQTSSKCAANVIQLVSEVSINIIISNDAEMYAKIIEFIVRTRRI